MTDNDTTRVLVRLHPSAPRRVVGTGMLGGLGGLLIWVAIAEPPQALIWQVMLVCIGVVSLWLAVRLWQSTTDVLELTAQVLREADSGRVLAQVTDIVAVDRGPFALKPASGFSLRMRNPGSRVWVPGMWWRMGHRVGVGGVTHRHEARFMAELLAERIKTRDAGKGA